MKKLPNLDSIRSLAFLTVFAAHAFSAETTEVIGNPIYQGIILFREVFSFGVPVFFVLSGFLISYLMLHEQHQNNSFSVVSFYVRRVLRIWPLYFLIVSFGFFVFPLLRGFVVDLPYVETANLQYYLVFLSNFDQIWNEQLPFGVGLGPTWSVSIEEQFYLIWPLLFFVFKGKRFVFPVLFILGISILFSVFYDLENQHTILCFIYLSMGGLFAYISFYYIHKTPSLFYNTWFFSLTVLTVFFLMYLSTISQYRVLLIIAISVLLGYIIYFQSFSGKLQFRKMPFIERLGKYTYGLYLFHSVVIFVIHSLVYKFVGLSESILTVVVLVPILSLVLSVIISYFSYRYFEGYFLNLKNRFSRL